MNADDQASTPGNHELTGRKLTFGQPTVLNYKFTISDNNIPVYFVKIMRNPSKPDITIRQENKEGIIRGVSWFRWNKLKLGVGEDEMSMRWSESSPKGPMTAVRYEFEWEGTTYSAHRIKSQDRQEMDIPKTTSPHFKIVEVASQKIVAVFTSEKGYRGKGSMSYVEGIDEDLQLLILLEVTSLRERKRRAG